MKVNNSINLLQYKLKLTMTKEICINLLLLLMMVMNKFNPIKTKNPKNSN